MLAKKLVTLFGVATLATTLTACQQSSKAADSKSETVKTAQKAKKVEKAKPVDYSTLTAKEKEYISQIQITAIGDSVMEGSAYKYQEIFKKMNLNTSVSRQIFELPDIEQTMLNAGQIKDIVLVGLGTNGTYTPDQMAQIMKEFGKERQVFWINVHTPDSSWEKQVNADLAKSAKKYKNLTIIDWAKYSKDHPDWFVADHTHPTTEGIDKIVTFVAKNIALKTM